MYLSIEYVILLSLIILFILCGGKSKHVFILLILIMTFMGVFRGLNVGTDHAGWEEDFYRIKSFNSSYYHDFEIGYVGLILLFKNFSNDWLWFSGLTFLIPMAGTFLFIKQYNINYAWAIFIFFVFGFYFTAFNAMRQYMAICSIAACTFLLKKNKYFQFALVAISISLLIHKSTIIMLLLIPIHFFAKKLDKHINKYFIYIIIVITYLLSFVDFKLISYPMLVILNLIGLSEDYSYYVSAGAVLNTNLFSLLFTLYVILLIYMSDECENSAEKYTIIVFIILYNIFNILSTYGIRVSYPFEFYMIIYMPMLLKKLNGTNKSMIIKIATIICGLGFFLAKYGFSNVADVNPYENWLFK